MYQFGKIKQCNEASQKCNCHTFQYGYWNFEKHSERSTHGPFEKNQKAIKAHNYGGPP